MAYRYAYYVLARPMIGDQDYDALERAFLAKKPPSSSPIWTVDSSLADGYDPAHRALALYLQLRFAKRK